MKTKISRSELQTLDPVDRMALVRGGRHIIIDDVPIPPSKLQAGEISRSEFDAMDQASRLAAVRSRKRIRDVAPSKNEGPGPGFRKAEGGIGWVKE
jgi:hypothetical protein